MRTTRVKERVNDMQKQQTTTAAGKRQSARAIAAAKTRALKAEIAAAVAQYTPDADGEAAALAAYFAAHTENVRTWAAAQAAATAFGYDSPEGTAARRASLAADRAAMVARCVYATVKSNARYMAMYGRVI